MTPTEIVMAQGVPADHVMFKDGPVLSSFQRYRVNPRSFSSQTAPMATRVLTNHNPDVVLHVFETHHIHYKKRVLTTICNHQYV